MQSRREPTRYASLESQSIWQTNFQKRTALALLFSLRDRRDARVDQDMQPMRRLARQLSQRVIEENIGASSSFP